MTKILAALHRTGGLSYHYMAWKYHHSLWRRYHDQLNYLLCDWKHFSKNIILIGPSGGYSLSSDFLRPFENIYVYDPDPLAQVIFTRRFPEKKVNWNFKSPLFTEDIDSNKALWRLKNQYPDSCLLFCNILGQWPLLQKQITEEQIQEFADTLAQVWSQSSWASFHDVFSGPSRWKKWPPPLKTKVTLDLTSFSDVKTFWSKTQGKSLTDHLTFKKFKHSKKTQHLIWPLTPRQIHLIEWVQG